MSVQIHLHAGKFPQVYLGACHVVSAHQIKILFPHQSCTVTCYRHKVAFHYFYLQILIYMVSKKNNSKILGP